jgi:hypothetical protein
VFAPNDISPPSRPLRSPPASCNLSARSRNPGAPESDATKSDSGSADANREAFRHVRLHATVVGARWEDGPEAIRELNW